MAERQRLQEDCQRLCQIAQLHRGGHMVSEIARRTGSTATEAARLIQALARPPSATLACLKAPQRCKRIRIAAWTPEILRDLWDLPMGRFHAKYLIEWYELQSVRQGLSVPPKPYGNFSKAKFTGQMLGLLGKRTDRRLARGFHLSETIVKKKRLALGIPSFKSSRSPWTPQHLALLGKMSDTQLARKIGRSNSAVCRKRQELGVKLQRTYFRWTKRNVALLLRRPAAAVAEKLGITLGQVMWKRQQLGIPTTQRQSMVWTPELTALVGTMPDLEVARRLGASTNAVRNKRLRLRLPPARADG